jgi:hypothetical protein
MEVSVLNMRVPMERGIEQSQFPCKGQAGGLLGRRGAARFLYCDRRSRRPAVSQRTHRPIRRSLPRRTIARRNLCSQVQAVLEFFRSSTRCRPSALTPFFWVVTQYIGAKPFRQRLARILEDRPRCHRGLVATFATLQQHRPHRPITITRAPRAPGIPPASAAGKGSPGTPAR